MMMPSLYDPKNVVFVYAELCICSESIEPFRNYPICVYLMRAYPVQQTWISVFFVVALYYGNAANNNVALLNSSNHARLVLH